MVLHPSVLAHEKQNLSRESVKRLLPLNHVVPWCYICSNSECLAAHYCLNLEDMLQMTSIIPREISVE